MYCPKCAADTAHLSVGKFDSMGTLVKVEDRCLRCGHVGDDHEAPAGDAQPPEVGLTHLERQRGRFVRRLIRRGVFSEYGDQAEA